MSQTIGGIRRTTRLAARDLFNKYPELAEDLQFVADLSDMVGGVAMECFELGHVEGRGDALTQGDPL